MISVVGIFDRPDIYEIVIRKEMVKLGAGKDDFALITPELVWDNFSKKRTPSDVAKAIMQIND